ncbi:MAG: hypothetical protein ACFCUQ_04785 [Kiloniellales bacterium]
MSGETTVVVTGYGAWAKTAPNPAALVLRQLAAQSWPGCRLVPIEVPVKTTVLLSLVRDALLAHRPAIWLGIGVAPGTVGVRGEMVGINWRDFDVPDNDDVTLDGVPIVEEGAAAHFSTLPIRAMVEAIQAEDIPASVSYAAGTHLCNQMLYTSLHLVDRHGLETRCGFLHVPYTPELAARLLAAEGPQPSMALADMSRAARIAIERALASLDTGLADSKADARLQPAT